jgi:hypothetical protein
MAKVQQSTEKLIRDTEASMPEDVNAYIVSAGVSVSIMLHC